MKISKIRMYLLSFLLFFTSLYATELNTSKINNYTILKEFYTQNQNKYMAIRAYELDSKSYFLLINLETLKTKIITSSEKSKLKKVDKQILIDTNFDILRKKALQNSFPLSNAGINDSFKKNKDEIYLTIDMCPSSKKGYEKELFEKLLNLNKLDKKIPISVAITYNWVDAHKEEFASLVNNPHLDITWINHSKTHYYNPKEELSKNFMLNSSNNLEEEIIAVEKMLILNHQIPSILFRFPGLISNTEIINKLINHYSLIPLGTNNWLAKSNNAIIDGDIILVHGNLNEKVGIVKLTNDLKNLELLKSIYNSLISKKNK